MGCNYIYSIVTIRWVAQNIILKISQTYRLVLKRNASRWIINLLVNLIFLLEAKLRFLYNETVKMGPSLIIIDAIPEPVLIFRYNLMV